MVFASNVEMCSFNNKISSWGNEISIPTYHQLKERTIPQWTTLCTFLQWKGLGLNDEYELGRFAFNAIGL